MAISYEDDMKRREREAQLRQQNQQATTADALRLSAMGAAAGAYPMAQDIRKNAHLFSPKTVNRATNVAKGIRRLARGNAILSGFEGAAKGFNTPTEQYRDRFGLQTDDPSLAGDLGVRALGVASDIGDAMTWGMAGKVLAGNGLGFADKNMAKWNPETTPNATAVTPANANRNVTTVDNPFMADVPRQPSKTNMTAQLSNSLNNIPKLGANFGHIQPSAGNPVMNRSELDTIAPATATASINGQQIEVKDTITPRPFYDVAKDRALQQTYSKVEAPDVRMPTRQGRGYLADIERGNMIRMLKSPVSGAKGMTAGQARALAEIAMQGDNLDMEAYKQQMAFGQENLRQQNENSRTTLQQQNDITKALLNETGTTHRNDANLGLDFAKMNAEVAQQQAQLGLDRDKLGLERRNSNVQNYNQNQMIILQQAYNNAQTDAEREAIAAKAHQLTALTGNSNNKDRYMEVKGGQEVSADGTPITRPSMVFDTRTGQYVSASPQPNTTPQVMPGQIVEGYRFKGGDPADQNNWEKI